MLAISTLGFWLFQKKNWTPCWRYWFILELTTPPPLEFSIDILNKVIMNLFWKSSLLKNEGPFIDRSKLNFLFQSWTDQTVPKYEGYITKKFLFNFFHKYWCNLWSFIGFEAVKVWLIVLHSFIYSFIIKILVLV